MKAGSEECLVCGEPHPAQSAGRTSRTEEAERMRVTLPSVIRNHEPPREGSTASSAADACRKDARSTEQGNAWRKGEREREKEKKSTGTPVATPHAHAPATAPHQRERAATTAATAAGQGPTREDEERQRTIVADRQLAPDRRRSNEAQRGRGGWVGGRIIRAPRSRARAAAIVVVDGAAAAAVPAAPGRSQTRDRRPWQKWASPRRCLRHCRRWRGSSTSRS